MASGPNIVIIYSDQQRYDTVGALGNKRIKTPNIDRLAAEGTAFTQATTPCPVCMPARWSLHSGQYSTSHGCYSNHRFGPRPSVDLPGTLKKSGYHTAIVGKNHSFLNSGDVGHFEENPMPANRLAFRKREEWINAKGRTAYPRLSSEPVPGGLEGDPDHAKTDEAIKFVRDAAARPFFLWLSYHHPHTPYYAPEPYFSMYEESPIGEPVSEGNLRAAGKPFRQQFHKQNNDSILPFDRKTVLRMRALYCGMISLLDAEVGRFLDFLNSRKLDRETLVVFMSDHGDYLGDHGLMTKSPSFYECLVRTPLIARWPGRLPGNIPSSELASHIDIMPTVLEAAGCRIPCACQGASLLPYMTGSKQGLREAAFSEYGYPGEPFSFERMKKTGVKPGDFTNPGNSLLPWEGNPVSLAGRIRMVRTPGWKLVEEPGGTSELYDLRQDPGELTNIYGRSEYGPARDRMHNLLNEWKRSLFQEETYQ